MILGGIAAPVADTAPMIQETKYGGGRPNDHFAWEHAWVWKRLADDWRRRLELSKAGESWAAQKPGTSVTYSVKMTGYPGFATTYRLVAASDDRVSISITVPDEKPQERPLPFKTDPKSVEEGTETLKIDGREFACTIRTFESTRKVWLCADAPFGWVKSVSGAETTQLVKLSEAVTVAGRKYPCSVWETVNGDLRIREWRSTDMPGLTVRWEEKTPKSTLVIEVTSIQKK